MLTYCYLDGAIIPAEQAVVPVTDLGLQRGFGVFDFVRTYNDRLFHLDDHLARFRNSAAELNLEVPEPDDRLKELGTELLERSDLHYPALKFVLTGGDASPSSPYDSPRLMIQAQNRPTFPDSVYREGAHLITAPHQRELPHIKSLNYLYSLRLEKQKQERGALDLLYYDHRYGVTESPRANVFAVIGGTLVTPFLHILKGITRKIILQLARNRFPLEERPISLEELREADECFICSTNKRIIPVRSLDNQVLGKQAPGHLTQAVMQLFNEYTDGYPSNMSRL